MARPPTGAKPAAPAVTGVEVLGLVPLVVLGLVGTRVVAGAEPVAEALPVSVGADEAGAEEVAADEAGADEAGADVVAAADEAGADEPLPAFLQRACAAGRTLSASQAC